jgi:sugar lactone lactonase YvrE
MSSIERFLGQSCPRPRRTSALAAKAASIVALTALGSAGLIAGTANAGGATTRPPAAARPSATTRPTATAKTADTTTTTGVYLGDSVNGVLVGFPLTANGNASPVTNLYASESQAATLALASNGDLWVGDDGVLNAFTNRQLAGDGNGAPAPTVSITNSYSAGGSGLAFDPSGDLWAGDLNNKTIIEYKPSQLTKSGAPKPTRTIDFGQSGLNGLAFDSSGDLWASNYNNSTLVEYSAAQLASTSKITAPAITITANDGSLDGPARITFDSSGDLWVANFGGDTISEFQADQLTSSGAPTPAVQLSSNDGSLDEPNGVAVDPSGDLWVANQGSSSAVEYTPGQLTAYGDPTPNQTIVGSNTGIDNPYVIATAPLPVPLPVSPTQLAAWDDPAQTANDNFGHGVAIAADGSDALVGADLSDSDAGAAYLYESSNGTWPSTPTATFADPGGGADHFGYSVALSPSGTTAFVGADHVTVSGASEAGAVYIYQESDGVWPSQPTVTITDPAAAADDYFGLSISVSSDGGTLAVGAPGTPGSNREEKVGDVYLFQSSGGVWPTTPTATFTDPVQDPTTFQLFGWSLAISNAGSGAGTLVVGAYDATVDGASSAGSAYVYQESGGAWDTTAAATLPDPNPATNDEFGLPVAINGAGTLLAVGAQGQEEHGQNGQGALYTYTLTDAIWTLHQTLTNDGFGGSFPTPSVSANGDTAVAGAFQLPVNGNSLSGAAYVYALGAKSDFTQTAFIGDPTGGSSAGPEYFGGGSAETADGAVSIISADTTTVNGQTGAGAVYIYNVTPMSITSFSPKKAGAGKAVTIIGANLAQVTGVDFNGVPAASFTVVSATKVTAVVPAHPGTGPITVTNAEGLTAASSTNFN